MSRLAIGLDIALARLDPGAPARAASGRDVALVPTSAGPVRLRDSGGPGPLVVLACDPPNVLEHYDGLFALLSASHRVVCLEMPGFGFSRPVRGFGFTLPDYARTVEEVVVDLDAGPVTVAFGCVWAYVALRLAADRPDLVRALVLTQSPEWADEAAWARRIDSTGAIRTPVLGQVLLAAAPVRIADRWYRAALPRGHLAESFVGPARTALTRGALFCLASLTQAWFGAGPPRLATVRQPAVLLWGAADRTHRRSTPGLAAVPEARVVIHDDAGHFPELEDPRRLVTALDDLT